MQLGNTIPFLVGKNEKRLEKGDRKCSRERDNYCYYNLFFTSFVRQQNFERLPFRFMNMNLLSASGKQIVRLQTEKKSDMEDNR
jgi:hypothetical protein